MSSENAAPRLGEYFLLQPDTRRGGRGHGVILENEARLLSLPRRILWPEGGGFPSLKEKPVLRLLLAEGDPPGDLEGGISGYWMVSERLKEVLSSLDPSGFAFAECEYLLPDGSIGPRYFLCDVVRVLDALCEESSKLTVEVSAEYVNGKFYDLTGGASVTFGKGAVGSAHVFKTPYSGDIVFCDAVVRDAVIGAGIVGPTDGSGLWFIDAADV